jgi:cell division initiation protein
MALTPVEIRHMTPGRGLFGYRKGQTDRLLAEIVESFEDVWRERADLADKVEQLETDLVRYRDLEALLRTTLVSAERASSEMKEQARREADLILSEAHAEARAVQRRARAEHERLVTESRRLRAQLVAALAAVDEEEATGDRGAEPVRTEAEPESAEQTWRGASLEEEASVPATGDPVRVDAPIESTEPTWHGLVAKALENPDVAAA